MLVSLFLRCYLSHSKLNTGIPRALQPSKSAWEQWTQRSVCLETAAQVPGVLTSLSPCLSKLHQNIQTVVHVKLPLMPDGKLDDRPDIWL